MIKTHEKSRFQLLTLEQIANTSDYVLQSEETGSKFEGNGRTVYLCEVVSRLDFKPATVEGLAMELVKANEDNRTLRRRIARLEADLRKAREQV